MKTTLTELINNAIETAKKNGEIPDVAIPSWRLEHPKNADHGDYAANVAMVSAKAVGMPPRKFAELLLKNLGDGGGAIKSSEIAGPGFINFKLDPSVWREVVREIARKGDKFGRTGVGGGKLVQVEFVSANPTGPLHVGHGRGAAVGDVLARILDAAGFNVKREYYINDAGNQIQTLGGSVYLRYQELLGKTVEFPDNFYQGSYIKDIAADVLKAEGEIYASMPEGDAIYKLGCYAGDRILGEIRDDLKRFGVEFDRWYSERSLYESGEVARVLKELEDKGVAYRSEGALWLNTTAHGDDKNRVLVRGDGRETYFASDIAYHLEKYRRGFGEIIDIWGADHHGYIPRLRAALIASGHDPKTFHVLMVQLVNLLRKGQPVSMSTRSGEFVTLEEVYTEVGVDAARFIFLTRSCDTQLDFDLDLAKSKTSDNPVFYVQYAHARIHSVFRGAKEAGVALPDPLTTDLSALELDEELELIKLLNLLPETVEGAALEREPHRLAFYLLELATRFHQYYTRQRFLVDDAALMNARLCLIWAVQRTIANGLGLLGVSAPESM